MRSTAAFVALAASLFAAPTFAQQPPAPPPPYAPYYGPWAPPPEIPVTERRSKGMMVTGIVLWGLGGLTTAIGATMTAIAVVHPCVVYTDIPLQAAARGERIGTGRQALSGCEASGWIGIGMLTAGVLTGALGVPFFVVGNSRVRAKPQPIASAPELRVGPTGATVSWKF